MTHISKTINILFNTCRLIYLVYKRNQNLYIVFKFHEHHKIIYNVDHGVALTAYFQILKTAYVVVDQKSIECNEM